MSALLQMELFQNRFSSSPKIRALADHHKTRVAEIIGIQDGGFAKRMLKGFCDFTQANSVGSRGITVNYILQAGRYYEVEQQTGWTRSRHYFCKAELGNIVEVEVKEVLRCLSVA
jgi:hypothetical protein